MLDSTGKPVIAYYDTSHEDLKLLICKNRYCALNMAPDVDAGADQTVSEGDSVAFSGSASDPEGRTLIIHWDFGEGSTAEGTLTPQHSYADDGDYSCRCSDGRDFATNCANLFRRQTIHNRLPPW